jgi:hypothetical protein
MTKPMVRIHNVKTDEVIDREMTDAEFAEYELEQAIRNEAITAAALKAEAKAGLLERLGITAEEAELLLS